MKKIGKIILAILIVFMQLSSPIEVFADIIDDGVVDNDTVNNDDNNKDNDNDKNLDNDLNDNDQNLDNNDDNKDDDNLNNDNDDQNLDNNNGNLNNNDDNDSDNDQNLDNKDDDNLNNNDDNDKKDDNLVNDDSKNDNNDNLDNNDSVDDKVNYEFDIDGSIGNNKVLVDIKKKTDGNFIADVVLTFNHIKNGSTKDIKEEEKVFVIDNSVVEFNDIGANLNGKYSIDVKVYKLDDDSIGLDEESLKQYISDKDTIYNKTKNIGENNIDVEFSIFTEGNNAISCDNKVCTLGVDADNKIVNISYSVSEGEEEITGYSVKYVVNNKIEFNELSLNFNNLIYGHYQIKGTLYNSNSEEVANDTLTINYDNFDNNDLVNYFMDSSISNTDKDISMTLLDNNKKKELISDIVSDAFTDELQCDVTVDSENGYFVAENCYGRISETDVLPMVSDVIQVLNDAGLDVTILDKDGNDAALDDYISTRMTLKVNFYGVIENYTILIRGDLDGGYVDENEINIVIDNIFDGSEFDDINKFVADVNRDGVIDVLDVSMFAGAICDMFWYYAGAESDNLIINFERENNNSIKVGDTFKINLKISGFENDYINAIEGLLDYDKSVFELVSIEGIDKLSDFSKLADDRFMFAGNYMYEDGVVLVLTFKALSASSSTIKLSDVVGAMDGVKLSITNDASVDISVEDNNNTSESESKPVATFGDNTNNNDVTSNNTVNNTDSEVYIPSILENRIYYNNYLSKLEIEGYEINFDKYVLEYRITVNNDVDSLDITAIPEDSSSTVSIYGNGNFKEGENIVKVVVTAKDGSERTYLITVYKNKPDVTKKIEGSDDGNSNNTEKTIIIILIVLVVLGLLYLIFKKDNE